MNTLSEGSNYLRLTDSVWESMVDQLNQGVLVVDDKLRVLFWNRFLEQSSSMKRGQVLGRELSALFPEIPTNWLKRKIANVFCLGSYSFASWRQRPYVFPFPSPRPLTGDCQYMRQDVTFFPLFDAEKDVMAVSITLTDRTEECLREEELQRLNNALSRSNEELDKFASLASHDLKAPLRTIDSFAGILESEYSHLLDPEGRLYFQHLQAGARRMQTMIDGILSLSRVQTKVLEPTDVDLNEVCQNVLLDLSETVQESGGRIIFDDMPTVVGELSLLRQLLMNLVGNGLKYRSAERAPEVSVRAFQDQTSWTVEVEDNGIGIESRFHQKIFGLFERLHSVEEFSGTGIGLALCLKIVERHQGQLWVESEPGEGSIFSFRIPRG